MNAQHGRQSASQQTAAPTDPRTRNQSPPATSDDSAGGICRRFIWGICSMGAQCIYRHELEFEAMKSVLKFCHDHQNRTGCTRPDCTYLHTSREEQNLFLATGQIPRVLIDRYTEISNASAAPPPVSENATSAPPQPHHMMYEYVTQPPPPPPPPPTPATAGAGLLHSPMMQGPILGPLTGNIHGPMPSSVQGPIPSSLQGPMQSPMSNSTQGPMSNSMQGPMSNSMQGPMLNSIQSPIPGPMQGPMPGSMQGPMPGPMQGPMPGPTQGAIPGPMHGPMPMPAPMPPIPAPIPPPPPPPPPTSAVSSTRTAGSIFTAPLPTHQNMTSYHPTVPQTSLPPMFDPTRPPPPIPQATPCRLLKRAAHENEAGPSKVRKVDTTNDGPCECCVRRLLRIDQLNHQMEQMEQEAEQARTELSIKMESYEKRKQLLRSIFTSPEMFRRAEDYVESGSSSLFSPRNEVFNTNIFSNPVTSSMNTNTTMVQTLLELLLGNSTRGLMESMPSSSTSDDPVGLLPLTARARPNKGSADILGTLLNLLKNMPSGASSSSGPSEAEVSIAGASGNGFSRFLSAGASPPPARARPLPPLTVSEVSAAGVPYAASVREAGPPRYPPPPRHFPPPPPAPSDPAPRPAPHPAPPLYPPAHPAHSAPPPRPPYAHGHFAPNNIHMGNPPYPGAALPQPLRPPMPPQQPQNSPYFMGGRYPNQHYYHPPYQ